MLMNNAKQNVSRISVSLSEQLLNNLDNMVRERGFESRSQAIAEMIHQQLAEHSKERGQDLMAGTINLVYDHATPGLHKHLSSLQYDFIDEVISSLNVNLVDNKTLQVILVQGPAGKLKMIADKMITCRGVLSGKLIMSTAIIPQIHPLPAAE